MSEEKVTTKLVSECPVCGETPCLQPPKCGLKYIADSPSKEHGGFHENAIRTAKEALELLASLESSNATQKDALEQLAINLAKESSRADRNYDQYEKLETATLKRESDDNTRILELESSNAELIEQAEKLAAELNQEIQRGDANFDHAEKLQASNAELKRKLESVEYFHVAYCNASRLNPIGCDMCICEEALKSAFAAEASNLSLREALRKLKVVHDSLDNCDCTNSSDHAVCLCGFADKAEEIMESALASEATQEKK